MTSNENNQVVLEEVNPSFCFSCKLNLETYSDQISCSECSNIYHFSCSKLSNKKIKEFSKQSSPIFKCHFCKAKNRCDKCSISVRPDINASIYCYDCKVLFCSNCAGISIEEAKNINTSQNLYRCIECSTD